MKLLALCAVFLLASCVSIQYEGFSYTRVGNQELVNVSIDMEKSPDGAMKLESYIGHQISEKELKSIIHKTVKDILRLYGVFL